jgi:glycosyltransferase involved in cell wall biosynthesis
MNKLSVVIITLNEEENIARCLNSVKEIADEIVVVDSFSTDKTKEICLQYNVIFDEHAFEGYIEQKNYAVSLCTNDFIFSIDADEAIDEKLKQAILKEKQQFSADGYLMNRLNFYGGRWLRHGSWYPDRKLRLYNKTRGQWKGQQVHELIVLDKEASIGRLKGDILHYSYLSLEGHIAQFNRFTTLSAQELFADGKKISAFGVFGKGFAAFFKGFFLKLGFLDGYYGIALCFINSFATFIKYMKLRELYKNLEK